MQIAAGMNGFLSASSGWYGGLIATAMILGMCLAYLAARYRGWDPDISFDICIWALPFAMIGARLNYVIWDCIFPGSEFSGYNFWSIIGFSGGSEATPKSGYEGMSGLSIFGGLIGGVLGAVCASLVYKRKGKSETLLNMFDLGAPFMVLGQAIGRWGNFANKELYGAEITNPALQWFPIAVQTDNGKFFQAFFFYESMLDLAIAAFCLWLLLGKRRSKKGTVFAVYLLLYGIVRSCMELARDSKFIMGGESGFPVSFAMSISAIVIGLGFLLFTVYRARMNGTRVPICVKREDWEETELDLFDWGRDPSEKLPPLFQWKKKEESTLTEEEIAAAEQIEDEMRLARKKKKSVTEDAADDEEDTAEDIFDDAKDMSATVLPKQELESEEPAPSKKTFARRKFIGKDE